MTGQTRTMLATAARLRARGLTWAAVGVALGRAEKTVRGWPTRHPREWSDEMAAAHREVIDEVAARARAALLDKLDSNDARAVIAAAGELLRHADRVQKMQAEAVRRAAGEAEEDHDGEPVILSLALRG